MTNSRWVEVTEHCRVYLDQQNRPVIFHGEFNVSKDPGYRLRMVEFDCHGTIPGVEAQGHWMRQGIIVESREPPEKLMDVAHEWQQCPTCFRLLVERRVQWICRACEQRTQEKRP